MLFVSNLLNIYHRYRKYHLTDAHQYQRDSFSYAEKVIYWTIILTPLWWLLGIQTICYPVIAAYLLFKGFKLHKIIQDSLPLCNISWLAMSIVVLWTNIFGFEREGFQTLKVAATLFTLFKGYFLIFACMTLPFWHRIRVQVITRAVAWMTAGWLVTLGIQLFILATIGQVPAFLPPLARAIPGEKLSLMVKFAIIQPFFRIPLPRTDLYTADPPILGVCALLCFFICWGETNRDLRKFSLAGCLVCLIISQSRLAWMCLPLALLIIACIRTNLARQSFLFVTSFIFLICTFFDSSFVDILGTSFKTFNSARADSSKDREYVITATMQAWQESPWIGWGLMGKTVTWGNGLFKLPLGTFSSYSQVLYLHGIFGFIFFVAALVATAYNFWEPATRGNHICQRAFASLVVLYLLSHATTLTWMAIYFWFFFIWLGAILAELKQQCVNIFRWEDISL